MYDPRIPGTTSHGNTAIRQWDRSSRGQSSEFRVQSSKCLHSELFLTTRNRGRLSRLVCYEVEPPVPPVNGPAVCLVAAQQTLLIQLGVGPRTVELVAAVNHRAQEMTALLA